MADLDSFRAKNTTNASQQQQQQQQHQGVPALPQPLVDYHVVLKEKSTHLSVATEFYRDHVQSIYGRVNHLSLSQLRDLKAMLDAFNQCKFGGSRSSSCDTSTAASTSISPVSFWIRKETAEKQARQQQHQNSTPKGMGKNHTAKKRRRTSPPSWALHHTSEDELRYTMLQGKRVYFVRANDDCLRHDVRTSGDPHRAAQRQLKKLRKRFAGPSTCVENGASATGSDNSHRPVPQNHSIEMNSSVSPKTTSLVVARRPELTSIVHTNHQKKKNLFQLVGADNLEERALRLCNQWIDDNNTTGMNRIIKKGLVSAFQEDIQHFQTKGLVAVNNGSSNNNNTILVDAINGFGNRMIDYYDELTTRHSLEGGSESRGDDASQLLAALGSGASGTSSTQGDDFGSAFVDNISIAQLRVLVAEDNAMSQKMIARILTRIGIACAHLHVVQNGQKAVEAEAQQPFDVVLMDLDMPVMDGVEACKRIQKRHKGNHSGAAVVFLTSHTSDDNRQECLKAGAVNFLSKPYNLKAITECLRDVAFSSAVSC